MSFWNILLIATTFFFVYARSRIQQEHPHNGHQLRHDCVSNLADDNFLLFAAALRSVWRENICPRWVLRHFVPSGRSSLVSLVPWAGAHFIQGEPTLSWYDETDLHEPNLPPTAEDLLLAESNETYHAGVRYAAWLFLLYSFFPALTLVE